MPSTDSQGRGRPQLVLCILIAAVLLFTGLEGIWAGWNKWLPGTMGRLRDAEAVGITAVAYGKWMGYASYRSVNRALLEGGLSVHKDDLEKFGKAHYLDVMEDPRLLEAGLAKASTLPSPDSEGIYYSQDENGFGLFFVAAFALFGISSSSWFWLYMSMYTVSVITACITFRRRTDILFFILALTSAHALVALLLPTLPKHDTMLIHGGRFLGIMASVAMFHIMFLLMERRRLSIFEVFAAALQTMIMCLTINARTSAAWMPIAISLLWSILWIRWYFSSKDTNASKNKPVLWPAIILFVGLAVLSFHRHWGQDEGFRDGLRSSGHVFWHSVVTAAHNHPDRTSRYAIPPEYPVFDDQVSYLLFDREIARRGESRKDYLMGDKDWIYRTTSPDLDFQWGKYDLVLRTVLLETAKQDPWYVVRSFFFEQPKAALRILFSNDFLRSTLMIKGVSIVIFVFALLMLLLRQPLSKDYLLPLACASVGVLLPVVCAAVFEVRVIELFYVFLVLIFTGIFFLIPLIRRYIGLASASLLGQR